MRDVQQIPLLQDGILIRIFIITKRLIITLIFLQMVI